ncbi:MAG: YlbL family protein [Acidimicrobiia bacterium]
MSTEPEVPSDPLDPPGPTGLPPSWPPASPGRSRTWVRALGVFISLVVVVAIAGLFLPLSYVIIEPGDATPVSGAVSVKGAPTYRSRGSLLFLTVSISNGKPNLWRYLGASFDDDAEVVSYDDYFRDTTPEQDRKRNLQAMDNSQQVATKVALEKLGYTVTESGTGARVLVVGEDAPAEGTVKSGDVVTAVDGQAVTLVDQLGPLVRAREPGEPVALTIERDGDDADVATVTVTTEANPREPNKGSAYLGIVAETRDLTFDFPVDVTIDPGPVSGPSAGLAFTLAIIDEMTPGSLTGGKKVAVTGEMLSDGTVGEIGGVAQKAVAADDAGAGLMLVPRSEAGAARPRAGSMTVVGVRTLDDALAALSAAGGDPIDVPVPQAA